MLDFITAPTIRMWAYNIMVAVMAALTVWGVLDGSKAAALNAVAAALFAVASANVDKPGKHEREN
jgi:hypothetical protein